MFQYAFMIRALVAGFAIALSTSLLGVNLVLSKNSLIGDGLSHVAFGSMAIGLAFNQEPLLISLIVSIAAAFLILKASKSSIVSGDALIGIISSSSLAIGVVMIQFKGMNADISSYMFGSILGINNMDVVIAVIIAMAVLVGFALMYNRLFAITFDEPFAKAVGEKTDTYHSLLAIASSIVIVVGMRLMGALLISGLIIFPTIIAMRWFHSYKTVTFSAVCFGIINFVLGLYLSANMNLPTGATIILVNLSVLLVSIIITSFLSQSSYSN